MFRKAAFFFSFYFIYAYFQRALAYFAGGAAVAVSHIGDQMCAVASENLPANVAPKIKPSQFCLTNLDSLVDLWGAAVVRA